MPFSCPWNFREYDKIAKLSLRKSSLPVKGLVNKKTGKIWNQNAAKFLHSKIAKLRCSESTVFYSMSINQYICMWEITVHIMPQILEFNFVIFPQLQTCDRYITYCKHTAEKYHIIQTDSQGWMLMKSWYFTKLYRKMSNSIFHNPNWLG